MDKRTDEKEVYAGTFETDVRDSACWLLKGNEVQIHPTEDC